MDTRSRTQNAKEGSDVLATTEVLGAPPEDARVIARYVRADASDRIRMCTIDSTGSTCPRPRSGA